MRNATWARWAPAFALWACGTAPVETAAPVESAVLVGAPLESAGPVAAPVAGPVGAAVETAVASGNGEPAVARSAALSLCEDPFEPDTAARAPNLAAGVVRRCFDAQEGDDRGKVDYFRMTAKDGVRFRIRLEDLGSGVAALDDDPDDLFLTLGIYVYSTTETTPWGSPLLVAGGEGPSLTATLPAGEYTVAIEAGAYFGGIEGGPGYGYSVSFLEGAPEPPPVARVEALVVAPAAVRIGSRATATVRLTAPAGPGGQIVTLSSSESCSDCRGQVATVPTSVTVPEGATTATFPVTTRATGTRGNTAVTLDARFIAADKRRTYARAQLSVRPR